VLTHSIIAALTDTAAIGPAAVLQQSIPAVGVMEICWTLPMPSRILDVKGETVFCLEAALAPVAVPTKSETGLEATLSVTYAAARSPPSA
jgi:hypothetical protein